MTTSQEVEDWRVKIKKKIWSEFAAEPNEAHGKFLMKKFDELCDTALFGISINSQTTEGTDALAKRQEAEERHLDRTEQVWQLDHTEQIWGLCRTYEQRWKNAEQRLKVVEAENARLKAALDRYSEDEMLLIERCAKECEVMGFKHSECPEMSEYCADAIRALKVEK